jgi:hypothetical protein
MAASAAPRGIDSRLIALSQLACVVLFGALLIQPWRASSPVLGAVFIVACATFGASAISVARVTAGPLRVVFGALAVMALSVGIGELSLILDPRTTAMGGLQEASSLELAVAVAALNGLLVLYGNYALGIERRVGEALQDRVTAEQALKAKLEQRVAERTLELDDAQRVLHRMWWLGQQITLELDPRRVLDRFLEAVADVAQADGAALGLVESDGTIVVTAANGILEPLAGERMPGGASVQGRVVQAGRTWCVADVDTHRDEVHASLFP